MRQKKNENIILQNDTNKQKYFTGNRHYLHFDCGECELLGSRDIEVQKGPVQGIKSIKGAFDFSCEYIEFTSNSAVMIL